MVANAAAEMDALVWLGPREMALRAEPVPRPAPGEVLIDVGAVGICGSELSGYLGHSSIRVPPLIMGHEAAGRLVGDSAAALADGSLARAGTRVAVNPLIVCGACDRCRAGRSSVCRRRQLVGAHRPGAFARFVAVPAAQCWPLPDHLSDVAGSLAEPLAVAVRAVQLADARSGEPLLILGAGPIGLCCIVAARARGVEEIVVSDVQPRRLDVARRWGARHAIDAREGDPLKVVDAHYSGGVGAAIDAVGIGATRAQAVRAVIPGGRALFLGLHEEETSLPANHMVRQEITVSGSYAYSPAEFGAALELLARGALAPGADWLEERPLSAGAASFEELIAGTAAPSKIVLRMERAG